MSRDAVEKVAATDVRRVTRTYHGKQRTIQWRGLPLTVKRLLTPSELVKTITEMIDRCRSGEDECPWLIDLSFRIGIVTSYALIELPGDLDELNFIMYETDLFEKVCENINQDQLSFIRNAVSL